AGIEDVERLALVGQLRAVGERRHLVHVGAERVTHVQVQVGVDPLVLQRIQKAAQTAACDRVERRVGAGGENAAGGLGVSVRRRVHVVQPDQVDAQTAQAFGHSGGVLRFGKTGTEGEVN